MKLPFRKPLRNQKGVVLIWMATLILAILAFVSLSIDVAKLLATRTQLQNAADAAALAGASALDESTGYLDPALAWTGVKHTGRGATLSRVGYETLTRPKSFHLRHEITS